MFSVSPCLSAEIKPVEPDEKPAETVVARAKDEEKTEVVDPPKKKRGRPPKKVEPQPEAEPAGEAPVEDEKKIVEGLKEQAREKLMSMAKRFKSPAAKKFLDKAGYKNVSSMPNNIEKLKDFLIMCDAHVEVLAGVNE